MICTKISVSFCIEFGSIKLDGYICVCSFKLGVDAWFGALWVFLDAYISAHDAFSHTHIWCSLFLSGPPPPLLLSSLLLLLAWFLFLFSVFLFFLCFCLCAVASVCFLLLSFSFFLVSFVCLFWEGVDALWLRFLLTLQTPECLRPCVYITQGAVFCREFPNSCELKRSPHACHPLCWDWLLSKSGIQLTTPLHAVDGLAAYWSLRFCCSFFEWRIFSGRCR